jgi:regulation of enolase protein 1 (concanavalin A-like superfamily)
MYARWKTGIGPMALVSVVLTLAVPAPAQDVIFRDDFDGATLGSGWTIIREDASAYSLSARPGYFRINTQRGRLSEGGNVNNLLVRSASGDFILEARLEFDPREARQFAGILVRQDDNRGVSLGLAYASGEGREFRGIVLINATDPNTEAERSGAFYDEDTTEDPTVVYLRLLRNGDEFVAAFSPDGETFTELGSAINEMPDSIQVGFAAGNGDFEECGSACDASIPADFDFFEISSFEGGGPSGDATLTGLSIDGPDTVTSGGTGAFTATASFDDGSTLDVSTDADWSVSPPERGTISDGQFTAATVGSSQNVTLVASYSHTSGGNTVTKSASKVVGIIVGSSGTDGGGGGGGGGLCGAGLAVVPIGLFIPYLVCLRRRWR